MNSDKLALCVTLNVLCAYLIVPNRLNIFQAGQRRVFFGMILDAYKVFKKVSDFIGRTNNVVVLFDNINRFMSSGGTTGQNQITPEHLDKIEQEIQGLADDVKSKQCIL